MRIVRSDEKGNQCQGGKVSVPDTQPRHGPNREHHLQQLSFLVFIYPLPQRRGLVAVKVYLWSHFLAKGVFYGCTILVFSSNVPAFFIGAFIQNGFHFDAYLASYVRDVRKSINRSSCKVSAIVVKLQVNVKAVYKFLQNSPITHFMATSSSCVLQLLHGVATARINTDGNVPGKNQNNRQRLNFNKITASWIIS